MGMAQNERARGTQVLIFLSSLLRCQMRNGMTPSKNPSNCWWPFRESPKLVHSQHPEGHSLPIAPASKGGVGVQPKNEPPSTNGRASWGSMFNRLAGKVSLSKLWVNLTPRVKLGVLCCIPFLGPYKKPVLNIFELLVRIPPAPHQLCDAFQVFWTSRPIFQPTRLIKQKHFLRWETYWILVCKNVEQI